MLTARTSTRDTVEGLESGANDYVPKPFTFEELLARVRRRLSDAAPRRSYALSRGDVELDLLARRITVGGQEIDLSAREFTLAEQFLRHPGEVLTREWLLSEVWGMNFDPGSNVVDVYVRYLRGKLGHDRITTVRGVGYRWE
jgi:DNA-binding response OmpR family regulator